MTDKEMLDPRSLGLPLQGADSHAHLDFPDMWPDFEGVMARARTAGVAIIGQMFLSHAAYEEKMDAMSGQPELFFALGLHPSDILQTVPGELDLIESDFANDDRLKAVGEIGLDFYREKSPPAEQVRMFRLQLRLAKRCDRPVIIHSRDAFAETLAVLDEEGFKDSPLLWHCFGGDRAMAMAILDRGWHISIPGPVTYPKNTALREAVKSIPPERLLLETDCPYLAPQGWRGKRNEPALAVFTAQAVAREKGLDTAELWSLCGQNTRLFFGLPE